MSTIYIFGYGSLLNETSLQKTSPTAQIVDWVVLHGYQRKMNAISDELPDIALNVVPCTDKSVKGVLIKFPEIDLPALKKRETGYEMIDITSLLAPEPVEKVFTFIAPNICEYGGRKLYQSYLDLCLCGVPESLQDEWLAETVIDCEITDEDREELYRSFQG